MGFWLWAVKVTQLSLGTQVWYIIVAGAGMGLMLGPAQTDAVNRASRYAYGEATGITQTIRNYAGSLGLAILGTILISQLRSRLTASLLAQHLSARVAAAHAAAISQSQGSGSAVSIPRFVRLDFAYATRTVFYVMAAIMAAGALVSLIGLRTGAQEEAHRSPADPPGAADGALAPAPARRPPAKTTAPSGT